MELELLAAASHAAEVGDSVGAKVMALLSLTLLEIVLGIDNIIFISILTGRLPEAQRAKARNIGLIGAMVMRILLLLVVSWLSKATATLFTLPFLSFISEDAADVSVRDLVLLAGGLFLIWKATKEIHHKIDEAEEHLEAGTVKKLAATFTSVITQIMLLDLVFSIDSVITAVGMAKDLWIMITAVVVSIGVMLLAAGKIGSFVERHPTVKVLALAFLILIGVMLVADAAGQHIPKGYIYFALTFSLGVEMVNLRISAKKRRLGQLPPAAPPAPHAA